MSFKLYSIRTTQALLFALMLFAPTFVMAQTAPVGLASPEGKTPTKNLSPQAMFIQNLGTRAIELLADKTLSKEDREQHFRNMMRDTFDLQTIARFVIGRSWLGTTPEQKTEYMDLFEALVIKTYSDRFTLYTGEGFAVRSSTPESVKDTIVNSDITHPDGSPATTVMWRVRQKDGKLGIIDVIVEGVSMSLTQRQEYASVIQRHGGDIEALLKLMRQRVGLATTAEKKG